MLVRSLAVISGYVGPRWWVYHFLPVTNLQAWSIGDTINTMPRLAGLTALPASNRTSTLITSTPSASSPFGPWQRPTGECGGFRRGR